MDDDDFYSTEAGQFIAGAHRYISAAKVLRYSKEAKRDGLLLVPVLHTLAHGMELLFKYPLIRSGLSQSEVASSYGHDLNRLWWLETNASIRLAVERSARTAWAQAKADKRWKKDDFSADPLEVLEKAVADLAVLHGRPSSFALRYTIGPDTWAPRPAFLIDAFGPVAEEIAMNPASLD